MSRRTIFVVLLSLFSGSTLPACLDNWDCRTGDAICDLPAFVLAYLLVNNCPTSRFSTYQGGNGIDRFKQVQQTLDGGYVAVGSANQSFGSPLNAHSGGDDILISRFDVSGTLLWHTFYGSAGADVGEDVLELSDGSLLIAGVAGGSFGTPINSFAGGTDMALLKLSASGALLWNTFYGAAGNDIGGQLVLRVDGRLWYLGVATGALTGSAGNALAAYSGGASMAAAVLLDTNGTPVLNGLLGPAGNAAAFRTGVATPNGAVLVGVSDTNFGAPTNAHSGLGNDIFLQQISNDLPSPQLGAFSFFGTTGADISTDSAYLTTNELVIVGRAANGVGLPLRAHSGGDDFIVIKLNSSAGRVFHTYLGQAGVDRAASTIVQADGTIVVVGQSDASWGSPLNAYNGSADWSVVKLTADGQLSSNTFFGSVGIDQADSVARTCDGGTIIAGGATNTLSGAPPVVNSHSGTTEDGALIKLLPGEF